ncbi:MAG: adenylyltransferase/cytidyltransferase family protein [Planctomycetota bacterium]
MEHKIFMDAHELVPVVERLRATGKTFAFANGCFELLHVGHVRYLAAAKAEADRLIVAVNSDDSMSRIKPDRRPVNRDGERMELIAAFAAVDFVVPLTENTPDSLLLLLRPEVHCKGTDYTVDQLPERDTVRSYGGRIALVGGPKVQSTRDMLSQLRGER